MRGGASKSRMDDPTTPRYAMSGFYIETGGFLYAAAIDARYRAGKRRHDMAASLREIGNAKVQPGWAGRLGRRAGKRPQGMAKRLTFREGRLRLPIGTTRLESQAFRQPRGGPMEAALILGSFSSRRRKGKASRRHRSQAHAQASAGMTCLLVPR